MASPIRRIIQLILDKASANRAESDAKKSLGGIEGAFNRLRGAARNLALTIGGIFAVHKIFEFAKESLAAAADAEKIWKNLAGTIDAVGGSFDKLGDRLKLTSAAFQDATVHSDEDYAQGLTRLITLTGDVDKSIQNMGLAANVAAQFFDGDLSSAIELVAKVSQGNVTMLQKMGIAAKSAQEGLDILATRSMGAAERQTRTLAGQTKQLANAWDDFKEEIGNAGVGANETTSILGLLTQTVRDATGWVANNKEALRDWVATGITLAIDGFRLLTSTVKDFLQWAGRLSLVSGSPGIILSDKRGGIQNQLNVLVSQRQQLEAEKKRIQAELDDVNSLGTAVKNGLLLGPLALLQSNAKAQGLKGDLQAVNDQLELVNKNVKTATDGLFNFGKAKPDGAFPINGKPTVVREKADDSGAKKAKELVDPIGESFKNLSSAMAVADGMSRLLGKDFDLNAAQTSALTTHLQDLLAAGLSPLDPYLVGVAMRLDEIAKREDKVGQVTKALNDQMKLIGIQASAFGDDFDKLGAQASALEQAITAMATLGFDAANPVMAGFIEQLRLVKEAMGQSKEEAENYALAVSNLTSLIVGSVGGGLKEVAKAKAKENFLLAAEQTAHGIVSLLSPFTAAKAGKHFAAAAKFAAIGGAWTALGASIGGGGGGGEALGSARGASGGASQGADKAQQEVNIYLEGPGFHAMNPAVQKVVYGAQQQAAQRYGPNAHVNVITTDR